MNDIYTIGYAGFDIDTFIATLKINNISCLVDVRSMPYSKYYKDYNKDNLKEKLKQHGILYRHYKKEFGAWQDNKQYYSEFLNKNNDLYLDFNRYRDSKEFQSGKTKIIKGLEMGYSFVFMCSEIEPIKCHRNIMVAKSFHDDNYNIVNLMPNNHIKLQSEIENELLKMFKNKLNKLDVNENDKLETAYNLINIKIGHKLKNL